MNNRREFLKTACAGGVCGCAGAWLTAGGAAAAIPPAECLSASATTLAAGIAGEAVGSSSPAAPPDELPRRWIAALLPALAAGGDREAARTALKAAASSHWDQLGMTEKLAPYHGNLEGLLTFLATQWGWKIERPEPGVILADEGKSKCVCPLVEQGTTADMTMLCYCSEGFAERLFGTVVGHAVHAEVDRSILRGGVSCRYRVTGI